tara:strand:- start:205 stop:321 length:117 start_codon:yes stop_codon:yes gene_type:complete
MNDGVLDVASGVRDGMLGLPTASAAAFGHPDRVKKKTP